MESAEDIAFNPDIIQRVFKSAWKIETSKDSILLASEFIRLFTIEAVQRASEEHRILTTDRNNNVIDSEHLERVLPQLLLDF
ncbi:hypothetical protein BDB01DRAFT_165918 [Pilobolus umbonatus]|nr:hypothetical protein BDB01DRAFT_165918 [Pilobolus umbonatus]